MPGIVIVGAGFGGIGMGIALKRAGFDDFVILEKSEDLGGTWHDNRYPGCACDVPSPLYSYSFELNPEWSRVFAPQQEIWDYLRGCARKYGVDEHIRYGVRVERLDWDDAARRWDIETVRGGASAIQFIPEIAGRAAHVSVFQRTPPWVHARPNVEIPARAREVFRRVPGAARGSRDTIYLLMELRALGFTINPKLMAPLEQMGRKHIEHQITDPALRAKVTPDYTIGCKRILLSSDYYPALQRPDVDLITDGIREITETGVVTADGLEHPADVIIYATGFKVVESVTSLNVAGRGGRKLTPEGLEAYKGVTVAGFPNFFMLLGPNTGLGHTSVVFMIESQVQHIMSCLRILARKRGDAIEVSEAAQRRYNTELQRRLRGSVWNAGGCDSWYLDADGVNRTIWPGFTFEYWARTRRARRSAYEVAPAAADSG